MKIYPVNKIIRYSFKQGRRDLIPVRLAPIPYMNHIVRKLEEARNETTQHQS